MKKIFLRIFNRAISVLFSLVGIGVVTTFSGCEYGSPVEYGTPSATYTFFGTVTNANNDSIPGIKVTSIDSSFYERPGTISVFTNHAGYYKCSFTSYPSEDIYTLKFTDVDSSLNGEYQDFDTVIDLTKAKFVNGDGSWYKGVKEKELNIVLKYKKY